MTIYALEPGPTSFGVMPAGVTANYLGAPVPATWMGVIVIVFALLIASHARRCATRVCGPRYRVLTRLGWGSYDAL